MTSQQFTLQFINPLRGLTEARLVSLLELGERGSYAELQWLYRAIEKRDPVGRAVKHRVMAAIGKLQWNVKAPDCGDDADRQAMADRQKATLRAAYDQVRNLRPALNFLALSEFRGFAHLEKVYAPDWTITELKPVEQWFWVRDGIYGAWEYNAQARVGTFTGTAVDAGRFIIREIDDPIGEIMAKLYVRKDNSDADWDGYLEDFGIPATIIEGPPNVPPEKEAEYKRQAENIASGAKGYIPNGAKVHSVTPGAGASVFKERLDFLNGELVIAATSGKLTVLAESGSGTLAGGAQKDAFDEIAEAIAQEINAVMQDGFDREVLARAHRGEPPLAYFEFTAVNEAAGSKALTDAKTAREAGFAVDADELSEKSGYKLTAAPAATQGLPSNAEATQPRVADTPGANGETQAVASPAPADQPPVVKTPAQSAGSESGAPSGVEPPQSKAPVTRATLADATAAQLGVTPEFLAPVGQTFDALIADAQDGTVTNDEFIARAEELMKKLPLLAKMMDATGIAAKLEAAMRAAAESALQSS